MRWDALFADLAAQAEALSRAELDAEVAERVRGEVGALGVVDRARAALGSQVRLRVRGALDVAGRVAGVGADWLLIEEPDGAETVVPLAQLVSVRGLPRYTAVPGSAGVVAARLGMRHLLRAIARDRAGVRLHLADGSALFGTVDRVGADFVEIAAHPPGEPRRPAGGQDVTVVALAAVAAVRRSG